MRNKVAEAEAKVEDYRAKSNLFVGTNNYERCRASSSPR